MEQSVQQMSWRILYAQAKGSTTHRDSKRFVYRCLAKSRSNDGQNAVDWSVLMPSQAVEVRLPEPMTGIEPAYSAWEADVLPLNYIGSSVITKASTRRGCGRYARRVLLSDRDIRAEIDAGALASTRSTTSLVQPSSVDVRLDSLFRVFNNTRYTHIDPAHAQDDLTTLVEPKEGEPFVLHPGEFVLGVDAGAVHAARRPRRPARGQVVARPARSAHPLDGRLHRPGLQRPHHPRAVQRREPADHAVAGHEDRPAVPAAADQPGRAPVRQRQGRARNTRASAARRRRGRTRTSSGPADREQTVAAGVSRVG